MSESEIIIPVSSISRKSSGGSVSKFKSSEKNIEVSLSKLLRLLDNHDFTVLSEKYGTSQVSISADLLLDLAAFDDSQMSVDNQSEKVSFLAIGLLGALFLSFLIMLIYLV